MLVLDLITILCVGLLSGNELAVSLFVNPALWKLESAPQAKAVNAFAQSLGKVMPLWYTLSLLLLIAEACVRRHTPGIHLLYGAIVIWVLTSLYSITALVPINNRLIRMDLASLPIRWRDEHKRWDNLHRIRIGLLIVAMGLLVLSVIRGI